LFTYAQAAGTNGLIARFRQLTVGRFNLAETLLVVEDEVLIRLDISSYLRAAGYDVLEAGNA
jgi:hypothetical protein